MNNNRPSNMIIGVFIAVAALFTFFAIGALFNVFFRDSSTRLDNENPPPGTSLEQLDRAN